MLLDDKVGLLPLNISVSGFRGFKDCTVYICAILESLKSVRISEDWNPFCLRIKEKTIFAKSRVQCVFPFVRSFILLYIRENERTNKNKHKYVLCPLARQVGVNGLAAPTGTKSWFRAEMTSKNPWIIAWNNNGVVFALLRRWIQPFRLLMERLFRAWYSNNLHFSLCVLDNSLTLQKIFLLYGTISISEDVHSGGDFTRH